MALTEPTVRTAPRVGVAPPSGAGCATPRPLAGVEEDLDQPHRRFVPDHLLSRRRLGGVALEDVSADLPAVLDGGGGELVPISPCRRKP